MQKEIKQRPVFIPAVVWVERRLAHLTYDFQIQRAVRKAAVHLVADLIGFAVEITTHLLVQRRVVELSRGTHGVGVGDAAGVDGLVDSTGEDR